MSTPKNAPYKERRREIAFLAKLANLRGPTLAVPLPSHRGSLLLIGALRGGR